MARGPGRTGSDIFLNRTFQTFSRIGLNFGFEIFEHMIQLIFFIIFCYSIVVLLYFYFIQFCNRERIKINLTTHIKDEIETHYLLQFSILKSYIKYFNSVQKIELNLSCSTGSIVCLFIFIYLSGGPCKSKGLRSLSMLVPNPFTCRVDFLPPNHQMVFLKKMATWLPCKSPLPLINGSPVTLFYFLSHNTSYKIISVMIYYIYN